MQQSVCLSLVFLLEDGEGVFYLLRLNAGLQSLALKPVSLQCGLLGLRGELLHLSFDGVHSFLD